MTGPQLSPWVEILWGIMGIGLVLYVLTGGADLGAGLWSLLATGPRKGEQRRAIHEAIAPIWEANHVWLIFLVVVMFSAFPKAFAAICISLHIPIGLALVGLVLRGSGFVFHAYGIHSDRAKAGWERVFAWASLATPILLGSVIGAVSTGEIRVQGGIVTTGFVAGWLSPFSVLLGGFALALSSMLAAVYLAADTQGKLAEDFRRRALLSEVVAGSFAALVFWRASSDAPLFFAGLADSPLTWPVQIATATAAFSTLGLVYRGRFAWARYTAATQVGLVVLGWGLAMRWHFVLPDISVANAGSLPTVLPWLVVGIGGGSVLLVPALIYLYRVFKQPGPDHDRPELPEKHRT